MNSYLNSINNIMIAGLGGVGTVYAKLLTNAGVDLRVLVDEKRLQKYRKTPRQLNGQDCNFKYILPTESFQPDLIIIATKSSGLDSVIEAVKPFVKENTLIMSFLNGISSEKELAKHFNEEQIIHSYIICHTITRIDNNIIHDGVTKIVWGDKANNPQKINLLKEFFNSTQLNNEYSENIIDALWKKFCFNCCVNQISAVTGFTFSQIKNSNDCLKQIEAISTEINNIATAIGLKLDLVKSSFEYLNEMIPDGKTSMLQDIENSRKPEIELFGAEVLKLAEKYNINVPHNKALYDKLKSLI